MSNAINKGNVGTGYEAGGETEPLMNMRSETQTGVSTATVVRRGMQTVLESDHERTAGQRTLERTIRQIMSDLRLPAFDGRRARITIHNADCVDPENLLLLEDLLEEFGDRVLLQGDLPKSVQDLLKKYFDHDTEAESDGINDDDADVEVEANVEPAPRSIWNRLANTRLGRLFGGGKKKQKEEVTMEAETDEQPSGVIEVSDERISLSTAIDNIEEELPRRTERARITIQKPGNIDAATRERIIALHEAHPERVFFAGNLEGIDDELLSGMRTATELAPDDEPIMAEVVEDELPLAEEFTDESQPADAQKGEMDIVTPAADWLDNDPVDSARATPTQAYTADDVPLATAVEPEPKPEPAMNPVSLATAIEDQSAAAPAVHVEAEKPTDPVSQPTAAAAVPAMANLQHRRRQALAAWLTAKLASPEDMALPELRINRLSLDDFNEQVCALFLRLAREAKGQIVLIDCVLPPDLQRMVDGMNKVRDGKRLSLITSYQPTTLNYGTMSDMIVTPPSQGSNGNQTAENPDEQK